jgi:hypothetical protein
LVAGVVLHLTSQVVRMRGWWHILRAAYPGCRTLRARDATSAYLAGAGLNALLPARAGDLVKLAVLHKRIPGSCYTTLAATSVPETAFETLCGAALVAWALALGFLPIPLVPGEIPGPDVSWYLTHPVTAWLVTAIAVWTILLVGGSLHRRCRTIARRLGQGFAIFRSPRNYTIHVAGWQALGRLIRLASLACFLAAFALPAGPRTALLVMAAQGGGRIIPIAPVSAGLRIAMLSYGLVELSDQAIDPAAVAAFTFGVSAVLFVVMLAISIVLIGRELQTRSPRLALRRARKRLLRGAPKRATVMPVRHLWRAPDAPRLARVRRLGPQSPRARAVPGSLLSCRAPPAKPHALKPRARPWSRRHDQDAAVSAAGRRKRRHAPPAPSSSQIAPRWASTMARDATRRGRDPGHRRCGHHRRDRTARRHGETMPRPRSPSSSVAALTGFAEAETQRIWLFFVPLACVTAAALIRKRRLTVVVALPLVQPLAVETLPDAIW